MKKKKKEVINLIVKDFTMIVNGKAFQQWRIEILEEYTNKTYTAIGDLLRTDFRTGKLTQKAVDRITEQIMVSVELQGGIPHKEDNDKHIREYFNRSWQ